jgi:serine/threonine protein kinase
VDKQRQRIVEELFQAALDLPEAERRTLVEGSGQPPDVRDEVYALLEHHEPGVDLFRFPARSELPLPERVGHFDIVSQLGEGGMGVVYEALQTEPVRRPVALKLIKPGMDSAEVLRRFEMERQTLAQIEHPNVARIYEAGVTDDGHPYFAMEFVDGEPITRYCDNNRLTPRERVRLLADVCRGIQEAHQRGVIHRDLKPTNILVATQDGRPVVKIIDFGVAKATDQSVVERSYFTQHGQPIGTPEYMSPEQAAGENVDIRSDVYSLGVILYELLAGVLPIEARSLREAGFDAMMRMIRESEPPRPSDRVSTQGEAATETAGLRRTNPRTLARSLRGELDWIALRALDKERGRRYATVAELEADLRAHLNDEPVQARPPSSWYTLRKFARRNRAWVTTGALAVGAILAFAVGMMVQASRVARERDRANRQTQVARQVTDYLTRLFEASDPGVAQGDTLTAMEILDRGAERIDELDDPEVRAELLSTLGGVYESLSRYEKALSLEERSHAIRVELDGPNNPVTLSELNNLANAHASLGHDEVAESLYTVAIEGWKAIGMEGDARAMDPVQNRAVMEARLGRWDASAEHLQAAAEARRALGGDDDPKLLSILRHLAGVWDMQERYDEAIELYEDVVARRRRVLGDDHPETITTLAELGACYLAADRLDEATPVLIEAEERGRRVLGKDHHKYRFVLRYVGYLHMMKQEYAEAVEVAKELLEYDRELYGPEHRRTLISMHNLASMYVEWGRDDEAKPLLEQVVELRSRILGNQHPHLHQSRYKLARLYARQDRYREALEQLQLAVDGGFAHELMLSDEDKEVFAALAANPKYQALLETVRDRIDRQESE